MGKGTLNLAVLKDTVQDGNINILAGSGLSTPFLGLLGGIEDLLSGIDQTNVPDGQKKLIRAALYKQYCEEVIFKNTKILSNDAASAPTLNNYKSFLKTINSILLNRKNPILSKQVNIFTTNVDIYFEKALEQLGLEYSDGFNGRFIPIFNLSNFRKSIFKKSLHYDNTSEIPVFNLLKLHGSLTWQICDVDGEKKIRFSPDLQLIKKMEENGYPDVAAAANGQTLDDLKALMRGKRASASTESFLQTYQELPIINPTKDKFKLTLLNEIHYELLRMYANELEKESTVLFVLGFSFNDEHIRQITLRAVNSNPTLTVYIIAHSSGSKAQYEAKLGLKDLKNRNIKIITPDEKPAEEGGGDQFAYDFEHINSELFGGLLKMIEEKRKHE